MVVHYLARELKRLGHQVRVVGASGWWSNRKLKFDYPVHRYPMLGKFFPRQLRFLQLLFDVLFYGADVINAHATFPAGYLAGLVKSVTRTPVVITPHGEDILMIPEIGFGDRLDPEKNGKIEYAIRKADRISAISETIREAAEELCEEQGKVVPIVNGVDNERFEREVPGPVHEWLDLPQDSRIILSVGNYHPRKGQEVIVRAMPRILQSHPEARLVIVGQRSEALAPLIEESGLVGKVILTGKLQFPFSSLWGGDTDTHQEPDRLAAIYQQSEIYVSAGMNEGAEGLSLALLDAMAAGLPVVATDISGNRDVVKDGVNGLLVRPGDEEDLAQAIGRVLGDRTLQGRMREQAVTDASSFSWNSIARQYLALYESVCSG